VGKSHNRWQETGYVWGLFGGGKRRAARVYRRFMEEVKDIGRHPELVGGGLLRSLGGWSKVGSLRASGEKMEYDSRILGSGDFVQAILREADENLARQMRHKKRKGLVERGIKKMCAEAWVKEEELGEGSQRRKVAELRLKLAYKMNREMGIPMAEIARHLGVGASAIAIAMAIRKEEGVK